jgi:UDP-N-acetylglucosamine acyltransferase
MGIDHRAIIDPKAQIAPDVQIAPYAIIGPDVEIGSGTSIGPHTVIHRNTKIGKNNQIDAFVSLGGDPQHAHYKGETTHLDIGDDNIIREFCTLNRGTTQGGARTRLGNRNFLMAYVHIAHDCVLGDDIVLANNSSLAGHVLVNDHVIFSAFCAAHQFVHIGAYSFLGRACKVGQDIPPYVLVTGSPGGPRGLNLVGLKRHGFSEQTLRILRRAYSLVYRQGLRLQDAIDQLLPMTDEYPALKPFIEMLQHSKRGMAR